MEERIYKKDIAELHKNIKVTSASSMTVLLTIILLLLTIIVWLFAGTVTEKAFARGLVFPEAGPSDVTLPYGGIVRNVFVEKGEYVTKGQNIALVSVGQAYSVVSSTASGSVFSSKRANDVFEPFEPVVSLVDADTPASDLVCIAYVDLKNLKDVRPGQDVQMWPCNHKKDEVGYVRGKVTGVSSFPTEAEEARARMRTSQYADDLIAAGSTVYQVEIDICTDKDNPQMPDWTFNSADHPAMTPGTICDMIIITKRSSVFSHLFMKGRARINKVKDWVD